MNKLGKILELYKREVRNNEPLHLDHKWIVTLSLEFTASEKEQLRLLIKYHNDLIKNLNYADLILSFILDKFILDKEFIKKIKRPPSLSPYSLTQESLDEFQYYIKILQEYVSTSRWMAETSPKTLTGILPLYLTAVLPDYEISEEILAFIGLDLLKEAIALLDETLDSCRKIIGYEDTQRHNSTIAVGGVINTILERDKIRYKEAEIGTDVHTNVFILDKFEQQLYNIKGKIGKAQEISNSLLNLVDINKQYVEDGYGNIYFKHDSCGHICTRKEYPLPTDFRRVKYPLPEDGNIYFKGGDIKEWQWDEDGKWGKYTRKNNDKKETKKTKQNPSSFVRENITKE